MNEPLRKYMKLGLVHWMAFPAVVKGDGPVVETVTQVATDEFFDVLEVSWITDPAARRQVASIASTSRLELYYGGMPRQKVTGLNINASDETERRAAIDTLKQGIDEACELNAKGFAFMSGKYAENATEQAFANLVASSDELCAYAAEKGGMNVNLEIFDNAIEHRSLIGPVEIAKRYADAMAQRHANFGLMVDLSHLPQLGETPAQSLLPVKNHIRHAHIGNAFLQNPNDPAYGDKHPRFGYPGAANDVDEIVDYLRTLFAAGYLKRDQSARPVVSLEVRPVGDESPALVIANAKRTLQLAWDRV